MSRKRIDTAYRRYLKQMRSIERTFLREANALMEQHRQAMVDAVMQYGAQSPTLAQFIRQEMRRLKSDIERITPEFTRRVDAVASFFLTEQMLALKDEEALAAVQPLVKREKERVIERINETIADFTDTTTASLVATLYTLQSGGSDEREIIARLFDMDFASGRASIYRHGRNKMKSDTQAKLFIAAGGILAAYYMAIDRQTGGKYKKQVIAAIDERTTQTCLLAHGQIQEIDKPFKLTGTPRYADEIMYPPFHDYCRTAYTLWLDEMSEEVGMSTDKMRAAARAELEAREKTGDRQEIHPAHATSRR